MDGAKFTGLPASFLSSIRVSVTGTRQKRPDVGKPFTAYKVQVECDDGRWEVQHRYSKLREVGGCHQPHECCAWLVGMWHRVTCVCAYRRRCTNT